MIIVGAGMAGMLAAHYFRHKSPVVLERQKSLPHNHKALLRFRDESVSDLTGIPFKKVFVQKNIEIDGAIFDRPTIESSNLYSQKVIGCVRQRSMSNLDDCFRYVAPEDFVQKLSNGINVDYGVNFDPTMVQDDTPVISTMPVMALANMLGYDLGVRLETRDIWVMSFELNMDCDVYQTMYYPSERHGCYRISITGNRVIAEFVHDESQYEEVVEIFNKILHALEIHFGITYKGDAEIRWDHQKYGKLIEDSTGAVKDFIRWATVEKNIYSLGRWATHRQILLNHVVKDIKHISRLIETKGYGR